MKNTLKKQLREKAKDHPITMGVLSVKNKVNGKEYIQGSLNLEALTNKMKFLLNGGMFTQSQLQKEWKEYGSEAFIFEFAVIIPLQENQYINYRQEISKAEEIVISKIKSELY
ncbi:GIY-YIG nuclease family protein [Chryseobacterium sp. Tr-659]|uniref:GIY-YIG nuclease family protein n=1 Tax=Chryseobacterium sp. Tr-659 TaxID=2608340 RepID=UPI001421E26A|nr:GIY-YIG nuclease family protein [Chryseobacterium sp. Tr-659]NIF07140.1 GIY-YIG nuclease family protein [Chryseobacterium sp. Tr-659]